MPGNNDGPMLFHPMAAPRHPVAVTVRASSGTAAAVGRLRAVVGEIDPQLRVGRVQSLDEMFWDRQSLTQTFGAVLGSVVLIVVLFSIAGLYTLMTFVVAQRWREIGVRSALGAQPGRLVAGIFGRALLPLVIGAVVGCGLAIVVNGVLPITEAGGRTIPGIVPLSMALMVVVGLFAAAGPAQRAIRIDPTEALHVD